MLEKGFWCKHNFIKIKLLEIQSSRAKLAKYMGWSLRYYDAKINHFIKITLAETTKIKEFCSLTDEEVLANFSQIKF